MPQEGVASQPVASELNGRLAEAMICNSVGVTIGQRIAGRDRRGGEFYDQSRLYELRAIEVRRLYRMPPMSVHSKDPVRFDDVRDVFGPLCQ